MVEHACDYQKNPTFQYGIFWLFLTFVWTLRVHFVENSNQFLKKNLQFFFDIKYFI